MASGHTKKTGNSPLASKKVKKYDVDKKETRNKNKARFEGAAFADDKKQTTLKGKLEKKARKRPALKKKLEKKAKTARTIKWADDVGDFLRGEGLPRRKSRSRKTGR